MAPLCRSGANARERWALTEENELVANRHQAAMDYRYDSGRAQCVVRPRDPVTLEVPTTVEPLTCNGPRPDRAAIRLAGRGAHVKGEPALAHVAGLGQASVAQASLPVVDASYYHGNLIGTTEVMTDAAGAAVHRAAYTAFGQPVYLAGTGVLPAGTRHGYAGAWGYRAGGGMKATIAPGADPEDRRTRDTHGRSW